MKYIAIISLLFCLGSNRAILPTIELAQPILYKGLLNAVNISTANNEKVLFLEVGDSIFKTNPLGPTLFSLPKNLNKKIVEVRLFDTKEKTRLLTSKWFQVKDLPTPLAYISGARGKTLNVKQLPYLDKIDNSIKYWDTDVRGEIVEFEMLYLEDGRFFSLKSNGSEFTLAQRTKLKSLKVRDFLFIRKIKIRMPDESFRRAGDLIYEVVF
ncbi:GldM C-terminal domain protein [Saprospira grandis DSM 2844]|uniref:GldM C-terminal domain protein n=1 Tax=Saprospira grandis DSM 2844 TaxID=694433 RepID=J0XZB8_9BACT|nr:GldM family protein [Saprospira grandis]EJF54536.1 GldM C-terminal domain protein [Saprospira grandis DSM 2844]